MEKENDKNENLYLEIANIPIIRAGIQSIPHIGGALDVLIFSKAQKIKEARFQNLIEALKVDLSKIKENLINKDYLESEEFLSLAERIFIEIINESNEQKRIYLKNALKNASIKSFSEYDKSTLIKLLQQVLDSHIYVLNLCSVLSERTNFYLSTLKRESDLKATTLESILEYLVSLGLVLKESEVLDSSGSINSSKETRDNVELDIELESVYEITELGEQLIRFIEA